MPNTHYQDFCKLASNELLRDLAGKRGAYAFYAKAELARRDRVAALGK